MADLPWTWHEQEFEAAQTNTEGSAKVEPESWLMRLSHEI